METPEPTDPQQPTRSKLLALQPEQLAAFAQVAAAQAASAQATAAGITDGRPAWPRNGARYQIIVYIRVSNERNGENYTFETQLSRIKTKLDSIYGPDTYDFETVEEDGKSGYYGPGATGIEKRIRPKIKDIQTRLLSGKYDAIAVYKQDRMFRQLRWSETFIEDIILPNNIAYISATEDLELHTAAGRLQAQFFAMISAHYRHAGSERCKDAMAKRAGEGFSLGAPRYGWSSRPKNPAEGLDRRGLQRNEEQGKHLKWMRERYLEGWPTSKIAGDLNGRGVPTPNARYSRGAMWTGTTVLKALLNPVHCGYTPVSKKYPSVQGDHFKDKYWTLSERETMIAMGMKRGKLFKTNSIRAKSYHQLNRLVTCHRCGHPLKPGLGHETSKHPVTGERLRYYRCHNGEAHGRRTCHNLAVPGQSLEDAVVREIERVAALPAVREQLEAQAASALALEDRALHQERSQLADRLEQSAECERKLRALLSREMISDAHFLEDRAKLHEESRAGQERLAEIDRVLARQGDRQAYLDKVRQALDDFPRCWSVLEPLERREILIQLIEKLSVDRVGRDAHVYLKLALLPEIEISLVMQSMRGRRKTLGVAGLTPRQLEFLHHFGQGKTYKEIALAMGISYNNTADFARLVRSRTGLRDLKEIYELAKDRIESLLPNMPMGSPRSRGVTGPDGQVLGEGLKEVLVLLATGASVDETAEIKGLTPQVVRARWARLKDFFGATTPFDLRRKAIARGYLKPDVL